MVEPVWEFSLRLPRHAFSVRDAARAGDIWRSFQEAAVEGSALAGWPPQRYRSEGTAFIVRSMAVRHDHEVTYGERTRARTWVSRFRRGIFSTRQVQIVSDRGLLVEATQEWAHVTKELRPARAAAELIASFPSHDESQPVILPEWDELPGPPVTTRYRCWYTRMDPLDHANHPAYLDWCDESLARHIAPQSIAPVRVRPVAERIVYRSGVSAPDEVIVESKRKGRTPDGALVLAHQVRTVDGTVCADATTVRTLFDGDTELLVRAWD